MFWKVNAIELWKTITQSNLKKVGLIDELAETDYTGFLCVRLCLNTGSTILPTRCYGNASMALFLSRDDTGIYGSHLSIVSKYRWRGLEHN